MASIWSDCARIARNRELAALATVVRRRGSLPMSATAKLLVTASGARIGTIGGGCLEAEVIERALDVMQTRTPAVSEHTLNAEVAGDYGLTCGGTATIFVEPVFADDTLIAAYDAAAAAVASDERASMKTAIDWTDGRPVKRVERGGSAGHDEPRILNGFVVEEIAPAPSLVVFGGGHVGAAIARVAAIAGWRVTVVDDRAEFADRARHPSAESVVCCDFRDVSSAIAIDDRTWAVVSTRGHQHDALIVDQLARRDLAYLGMLGSRRKVELTWQVLEGWGVPRERLERVHAPVGLAIGADTPEEIAVSVVAEMIAVRRRGSRRRGGLEAVSSTA